jgi:hypothetical protein
MRVRSHHPYGRLAKAAMAMEVLLSVGALGGGAALMLGPEGQLIPLPLSSLSGSPFDTYFLPGLILFGVLGLGPLVAVALAWCTHRLAPLATVGTGAALLGWLGVEIAIVGYSNDPPLQPIYLLIGILISVVGLRWVTNDGLKARSKAVAT